MAAIRDDSVSFPEMLQESWWWKFCFLAGNVIKNCGETEMAILYPSQIKNINAGRDGGGTMFPWRIIPGFIPINMNPAGSVLPIQI